MTLNDQSLIRQMIQAGKMESIRDLLPEYHRVKAEAMIQAMGEKYCCHPANRVKRLDAPLPSPSDSKQPKVLSRKSA